jgi:hypothetical protein
MNWKLIRSVKSLEAASSRRRFLGATAGSGVVLSTGLSTAARADSDESEGCPVPLPQTHITAPPGLHFYFPGRIDGAMATTDPSGTHSEGRDPSTITNFAGFVGQVDLTFTGQGVDTKTGAKAAYTFHTDTRFMKGTFVGSDERKHEGAFAFI